VADSDEPDALDLIDELIELTRLDLRLIADLASTALDNGACEVGDDVAKALELVQGTGLVMTTLVDGLAVRSADRGGDADPNALYERAQRSSRTSATANSWDVERKAEVAVCQ
jgi:hypothetical protein